MFELNNDPVIGLMNIVSGVLLKSNATGVNGLTTPITDIYIGGIHAAGFQGNPSIALVMVFSAKPPDTEIKALVSWAIEYYALQTAPPVDPLTIDYWDAELGVTLVGGEVDRWIGRMAGTILQPPSALRRPLYAPDAAFRGKNAVQCVAASQKNLAGVLASPVASGSRPWTISVYRLTAPFIANSAWGVLSIGTPGGDDQHFVNYNNFFGGSNLRGAYKFGTVQATPVADQLAHVVEFWPEGALMRMRDNGVLFEQATNVATAAAASTVSIGRSATGDGLPANMSSVFHMICSAKPSDAYIASLVSWIQANKI